MSDLQTEEILRQLRMINKNLVGIGVLVFGILICLVILLVKR